MRPLGCVSFPKPCFYEPREQGSLDRNENLGSIRTVGLPFASLLRLKLVELVSVSAPTSIVHGGIVLWTHRPLR